MIIVRIWEGLGNQMFQYAYARALSESGIKVCLDLEKSFDESFYRDKRHKVRKVTIQNYRIRLKGATRRNIRKYNYLKRKKKSDKIIYWMAVRNKWFYNFIDEKYAGYSDNTVSLKGNYYVKGWFQSPKYFDNVRDILLREFVPRNKIIISKKLKKLLNDSQTVSVHIRRGDYANIHNELDIKYYECAIMEIKLYFSNPVFIIFTDDYEWVKNNMTLPQESYFIDENEDLEDYEQLMVMSRCKGNIIANSTFSWWAAWLNQNPGKLVIMPKKWLKGQEGLIMKEWIIL